jgi:diguanylate cyclase (GGDEF)-like protein
MVGNLLTAFLQLLPIDLTAVFASIMGTIIAYTLLFTEAFQIVPLAREEIVENMQDGFILVDLKKRFIDANRAAKQLFPALEYATVGLLITDLKMALWNNEGEFSPEFSAETESGTKHYRVSVNTVVYKGHTICTCVTIYDNTSLRKMMDEITRLAEYDGLTNLMNRRSFCRDAEKKCGELLRYGGKAFFMMIDIDFFKKVNDTYGHLAGDEVLQAVSCALSRRFRKTDMLGRYGGEEFCAFLLIPDDQKAAEIAEECRTQIEALLIPFENKTLHVTISIGLAEFPSGREQTLTELISRADAALYKAKAGGRNRVVLDCGALNQTPE